MDNKLSTLTREELYEQVWSTPMRRLAKQYNLSDAGLAKFCRRYNIPRPPSGYWAQKEVGKAPPQTPLPPLNEQEPIPAPSCASGLGAESRRKRSMHLLVAAAKAQLLRGKTDTVQMISTNSHTAASIRVSRKSINRAVRLFQQLIHLWNEAGGTVRCSDDNGGGTDFCLGEHSIPIRLSETLEPISISSPSRRYLSRKFDQFHRPSGKLMFSCPKEQSGDLPSEWKDDDQQKLEDLLPQIIQIIPAQIERRKAMIADRACEQRQREKIDARNKVKLKLDEDEEDWEKYFLDMMHKRQQAQQIRALVYDVQCSIDSGQQRIKDVQKYGRWQAWADYFIAKFDPFMWAIPRPGEDTEAHNTPVSELDLTSMTRAAVNAIGAKDTNDLVGMTQEILSQHTSDSRKVWEELRRVLGGLGYDVGEQRKET